MRIHNICLRGEIRKYIIIFVKKSALTGVMRPTILLCHWLIELRVYVTVSCRESRRGLTPLTDTPHCSIRSQNHSRDATTCLN